MMQQPRPKIHRFVITFQMTMHNKFMTATSFTLKFASIWCYTSFLANDSYNNISLEFLLKFIVFVSDFLKLLISMP